MNETSEKQQFHREINACPAYKDKMRVSFPGEFDARGLSWVIALRVKSRFASRDDGNNSDVQPNKKKHPKKQQQQQQANKTAKAVAAQNNGTTT